MSNRYKTRRQIREAKRTRLSVLVGLCLLLAFLYAIAGIAYFDSVSDTPAQQDLILFTLGMGSFVWFAGAVLALMEVNNV
tara:strand:- start:5471 stop:5710 length:240 start_codon:yes stop_codon:yes gene_type:complete